MNNSFEHIDLPSIIQELSAVQKFWFTSAIADMAGVNVHADRKEWNFLKEDLNFLDTKDQVEEIISMVKGLEKGISPYLEKLELEPRQIFLFLNI